MTAPDRQRQQAKYAAFLLLILLLFTRFAPAATPGETSPDWLPGLLEKEKITIVVTDSGLGGLSVVADAAVKFRQHPVFRDVNLVFVNALFRDHGGYNSLQSRSEKLAVFSSALKSMEERYEPDLILVACNTLSVLVPDTPFAMASSTPVVGIVENGVNQIAEQLLGQSAGKNIMFATQTTVDEGTHIARLLDRGIGGEQIVAQACPQLTMYIEQGYDSMETELLIDAYVDEALSGMGEIDGPLTVSFNCTHFGYSLASWKLAFESRGVEVAAYLDPNTQMVDFLLPESMWQRFPRSEVSVTAVSMIDIPAASIESIGRYLHSVSPDTERALREIQIRPDLFEWQSLVAGAGD